MSTTAADLLIEFFRARDKQVFQFSRIWAAVDDIELHIDAWKSLGQDVRHFRDAMVNVKQSINSYLRPTMVFYNPAIEGLPSGDLGVLGWISQRISDVSPTFDERSRDDIRDMLTNVSRAVVDDTTIPEDLRLHIARLIRHVEDVLDEFAISGDFALMDALDRLMGAVRIAEAKSTNTAQWSDLWTEWIKPIALGMIVTIPSVGLQIGQMLSLE